MSAAAHASPSRRRAAGVAVLTAVTVALAAACGTAGDGDDGSGPPRIVTTTTILGDVLGDVVGADGSVEVLMPVGADPHEFALSVRQAATLQEADLIVTSGLDFETGLLDAVAAAEDGGVPVLRLGEELDPLTLDDLGREPDDEGHGGAEDRQDRDLDPHWFTDPVRMAGAVGLMADALIEHTDVAATVEDRATAVTNELRALDDEIRTILAPIESEDRELVTDHEVLGYFAARYDLTVLATVVPGGTTLAETSPRALTGLVDTVDEAGVPAIFVESSPSHDLAEALADEVDRPVEIVELYTESLGEPGSDGDSYADMIRADAERIVKALT
jgi:zinc/manganese transport system substrate-binding protein